MPRKRPSPVPGLLILVAASTASAGIYELRWVTVDGGGGTSAAVQPSVQLQLIGTIGQHDAGTMAGMGGSAFELRGGFWPALAVATGGCATAAGCCDLDANGARDDACTWCACDAQCVIRDLDAFADLGGAFGQCDPDGFANVHDRNHALTCFSGANPCDAINLDAGGSFGSCNPDGFCNIHDANHALTAFSGANTCSCPQGPMPELPPTTAGTATVAVIGPPGPIRPGGRVAVAVAVLGDLPALQSAQVSLVVSGGTSGFLELIDVTVSEVGPFDARLRPFSAVNVATAQMLVGVEQDVAAPVQESAELAVFTFAVSRDARGPFVIEALVGDNDTVLIAPGNRPIDIEETLPAIVRIGSEKEQPDVSLGGVR